MNRNILYSALLIILMSVVSFAQDDSEEDTVSAESYEKEILKKENKYLKFKEAFLESLRQKNIENYNKALESLEVCEKIYPENTAMLFEQAKNNFKLKLNDEAQHYCEKALEIEPNNFWLLALSRDIYEKENNYEEAIKIQKQLFTIKQSEAQGLLKLYFKTKNKTEGKLLLAEIKSKAININGSEYYSRYFNSESTYKKAVVPQKNQPNDLTSLQKRFTENNEYLVLKEIIEKELQAKQYQKLVKDSELGLSLFPAQAQVYLYNGIALNKLKDYQKASSVLESGLDFSFDTVQLKKFYQELIIAYTKLSNSKKVKIYKNLVQKLKQS